MIKLTIKGNPIPKQADRSYINWKMYNPKTRRKGVILHYQPKEIKDYEKLVELQVKRFKLQERLDCSIKICYKFYIERPKSKSKKIVWAKWKPDIDNLEKCITDCIKDFFMTEDSRICEKHSYKKYAEPGTEPRVEIEIEKLEE